MGLAENFKKFLDSEEGAIAMQEFGEIHKILLTKTIQNQTLQTKPVKKH